MTKNLKSTSNMKKSELIAQLNLLKLNNIIQHNENSQIVVRHGNKVYCKVIFPDWVLPSHRSQEISSNLSSTTIVSELESVVNEARELYEGKEHLPYLTKAKSLSGSIVFLSRKKEDWLKFYYNGEWIIKNWEEE